MTFYSGLETDAARAHHDELITKQRAAGVPSPRSGKRKGRGQ
jgi:hypothetical protein